MKLDKLTAWAVQQLDNVRYPVRPGYSLEDSLRDYLDEGPWREFELNALSAAMEQTPDFTAECLEIVENKAAAGADEFSAWRREMGE